MRILASSSIRLLSFSSCFSFETKGRSALSVLLRLRETLDSPPHVGREVWGGSSATGVDLEPHEKGNGINLVNVRNESLETREVMGEEGAGSAITPSGVGGLGSKSLWVLEPPFTTRTNKRKGRSGHTEWVHTRPSW